MVSMGKGSVVRYRQIDPDVYDARFLVDGTNMNLDVSNVWIGQIVHIAPKEDVRPGSVNSPISRLMAPYAKKVIVDPSECCDLIDPDEPGYNVCPKCVESWCWDYCVRYVAAWVDHGTYVSYSTFGCRCPDCRIAAKKYLKARSGGNPDNVRSVGSHGRYPSASTEGQ